MKNNYKLILKRLKKIKIPENSITPIIILAEKIENGSYQIAEIFKNYRRRDFTLKNEKKFNDFLEKANQYDCTIIIDDVLKCISKPMANKVVLNCSNNELYRILNEEEGQEKEVGQIIKKNLEEIAENKEDVFIKDLKKGKNKYEKKD